jgi:hypothetical protein
VDRHLFDQGDGFRCNRWPTLPDPRFSSPEQPEAQPVPPHQGVGLHADQGFSLASDPTRQQHEHLSIPLGHLRTAHLSFQHDQLLAQEHVLRDQFAPASFQISQRSYHLLACRWPGPLLEPRLKPDHPLLYDLLYLSVYRVDHQWLTDL